MLCCTIRVVLLARMQGYALPNMSSRSSIIATANAHLHHQTTSDEEKQSPWTDLNCGDGKHMLEEEGFTPEVHTFVAALKASSSKCDLEAGKRIHADVMKYGYDTDIHVASTLIDMYAKCGSIMDARKVFEEMPQRNVVSWNAMIKGYAQNEMGDAALQLYERMQKEGFTPNARTFVSALKACGSTAAQEAGMGVEGKQTKFTCLEKGKSIHATLTERGLESNLFVANALMSTYAKCRSIEDARRIFQAMPYHTVVSWSIIIMGYAQMGMGESSLRLYIHMQHEGFKPDAKTFVAVLKACISLAAEEQGKKVDGKLLKVKCLQTSRAIHAQLAKSGLESKIFVANTLVDLYTKCGSAVDARRVFDNMKHRTIVSWTVMIMGYAEMEMGRLGLQLYVRMQQEGFTPNAHTFVAALNACSSVPSLEAGKDIHVQICKASLESNAFVAACLIDMYAKCGSMVDAQQFFDSLPVRHLVAWNVLITGYSDQGDSKSVFDLLKRMQLQGTQPDGVTFVSLLTVCNHAGLVNEGQRLFWAMSSKHQMVPAAKHYCCLVDLLGRVNQLDEALAIVNRMPYQPDKVIWVAILDACRKWNNMKIANHAFYCAVRLDEKYSAAYALARSLSENS